MQYLLIRNKKIHSVLRVSEVHVQNSQSKMKFCREIDKNNRIFYDPISNQFLLNGIEPLEVGLVMEYQIIELVEQSEIAGLSQDEILFIVSGLLI